MSHKEKEIRGLSVVVIKRNDSILVSPGYDKVKKKSFFRLLGGGIDFGESAVKALKRELKEELDATLKNIRLLEISENIFVYNKKPGHEICFIYEAEFKNKKLYEKESFKILDSDRKGEVIWVKLNATNIAKIMPPAARKHLKS